jgi:hypothetical protein
MSRVARSARNASRMRVETITADKTITAAESGELYFIDAGGVLSITLPTPEEGSYYRFILSDDATLAVGITGSATNYFVGYAKQIVSSHPDATPATGVGIVTDAANGSSDHKFQFSEGAKEGSWFECWSDGTKWYVAAEVTGATAVIS